MLYTLFYNVEPETKLGFAATYFFCGVFHVMFILLIQHFLSAFPLIFVSSLD